MSKLGAVLAAAALASIAGCAGGPPAASSPARAELAPTGVLRVAVFTGNPVIGTRDKATGRVTGTTATLGRALAAQAGVPADIREYTAVAKLMEDAKSGAWDVAVVAIDPARRNVIDYAPPHIVVDLTYLVAPGARIGSAADADRAGVRIAAARGAATTLFLERTLRNATVVTADNEPAAIALVREGKAEAYAQNRYMLLGLAAGLPGARVVADRFSAAELALALPKGRPSALEYVSRFVESAKRSGTVSRAIEDAGLRGVAVAPAAR
jgi:polar amino acid transport system substrate-binding protein